jgi:hypothetical protein
MVGPGNAKKYPYNVMIKGLSAEKFYLPNGTGGYEEVTATPDELNTLNLLSRKYTVYSADALNAGDLLHITGYDASDDVFSVEKADADTSGKQAQLIATEANEGATTSEAADTYELLDLNTNSATVGDPVYLDPTTAGNWTLSKPTGADQIAQIVGRVKVKSTDAGKIAFNVVKTEIVAFGTSALQADAITSAKIAPATVLATDIAPDVARKFTVYCAVPLAIGELLHISSYDASDDVFTVEKADADTSGKPAQLIASSVNAGATTSEARDIQELTTLDTNAGNVGDPVYLDPTTAGNWTLTPPTGADQLKQIVGRIKVKSATVGEIVFNTVEAEIVAFGSSALQPASVLKTKLAGGFSKVTIADGTASATDVTVSGMAVGDELVSVLALATKAAITSLADRTSEYAVGAGKLVKAAGENETSNQLIIVWNDLT